MDLGAFIFFLFVCLLLSLWRPLPPCLTFGHIPFGTGSETLKFFVYVCCCFVALNNDSESKNHVGHTHAQTPFKWPWCSRSSALIQFYAKLVLLPFLPLKRVRRKWNYTNSYLRYWIEIAAMCIIRLLFRIKFDLIWNSLKIFFSAQFHIFMKFISKIRYAIKSTAVTLLKLIEKWHPIQLNSACTPRGVHWKCWPKKECEKATSNWRYAFFVRIKLSQKPLNLFISHSSSSIVIADATM